MSTNTTQPVSKNLREQMVQRMQVAAEKDLLFTYVMRMNLSTLNLQRSTCLLG
jgi:hypothetical protein